MKTTADCCSQPQMIVEKVVEDDSGAKMTIKKCASCQTYWRVVVDRVTNDDGDISESEWYQLLTEPQAEAILADAAST
jgi:hypothetical protein